MKSMIARYIERFTESLPKPNWVEAMYYVILLMAYMTALMMGVFMFDQTNLDMRLEIIRIILAVIIFTSPVYIFPLMSFSWRISQKLRFRPIYYLLNFLPLLIVWMILNLWVFK